MGDDKITKQVYEQLSEFRYKIRKFIRFSESASRQRGITPQQHQLLLAIKGFPNKESATPTELAERLQLTHHACVGLIGRSEQMNLVSKAPNLADGRSILIKITEHGANLLEQLSEIHLNELRDIGLFQLK